MSDTNNRLTRRHFVGGSLMTALGLAGATCWGGSVSANASPGIMPLKKRSLRFAHFTDIHLFAERNAPKGLTAALRHVHALDDKPDMLITSGDNVMDCLGKDDATATLQYTLLKKIFAEECHIPVKFGIGNHDVWGWAKNGKTTGNEALWGKKRPVYELDLPSRYYSFDKGPWRFIMLDSICADETSSYIAKLDEEQFAWLQAELKTHKDKYICIVSHIPIVAASAIFYGQYEKTGQWIIPQQRLMLDARRLKDLFGKHPNVRLCLSGHLHFVERLEYNNVTYICDGAVCGEWWNGNRAGFEEGYGVIDLYDDGTFNHQYVAYGWQA